MEQIGARLREARIRAKIDINQVEAQTKIRAKYLRAIENEEWDLLPGDVYTRSFLRTYADYLGLDSRELLDDFRRRYERPSDHDLRPLAPHGRERGGAGRGGGARRRRPRLPPWVAVVVVLAVVVVALILVGNSSNNGNSSSTTRSSRTAGQVTHATRRHRPHPPRPRHVAPTVVHLQLVPTGTVYVCLVDGAGRRLIPGRTFAAGQSIPAQSAGKLLLTLGNNQVTMKVDGVTVPVPDSASAIGIELTPGHRVPLPASRQPQCT